MPEGASIVDTELGILVVFATGTDDASVHAGAAVDSMLLTYYDDVSLWPEPLFPTLPSGYKETAIGLIWDGWYPWVYSENMGTWLYVSVGSNPFLSDGGWFGWDMLASKWIYSAEDYGPYYWDYYAGSCVSVPN